MVIEKQVNSFKYCHVHSVSVLFDFFSDFVNIVYNNTGVLCVCLSHLRYPERKVVLLHSLDCLEELHLASCTKCFLSLHDKQFKRKSLWKVFASYTPNSVHTPLHFRLPWEGWNLPTKTKPLEHSQRVKRWTHPPHYRYHNYYCFLCEWATDTVLDLVLFICFFCGT